MKVLVLVFVTVFFLGCGINTNSSVGYSSSESDLGIDDDTNTSTDTDNNTTTDDTTDGDGGTVIVDDSSDSGFSQTDAQEDPNACIINDTFKVIEDSSFDPNAVADYENGLELASQYDYSPDLEATKVALFYPDLGTLLLDQTIHVYEDYYRLSFDKAWSSSNLPRVYIRTPKDIFGAYSCYRYELDSVSDDSITKTKVYR